ncbi:MAG: hypothetical protein ACFE0R_20440 [Salinarimonas sp.]
MKKPMRTILTALVAIATAGPHAAALDELTTYLIRGDEIVSVAVEPPEMEDPLRMTLTLDSDVRDEPVVIESDADLAECALLIDGIIGDPGSRVEIVVHETTDTMNGVLVIQCARF